MIESVQLIEIRQEMLRQEPPRGIPFKKLREGLCKFPLGSLYDPPERFCGEPAPVGLPYCEDCRRHAYVRATRRR